MLLHIAGAGQIGLALAHAAFPKRLNWHEDTSKMSPVNRQIFWVHTYFVVLTVGLLGGLSLCCADALLAPSRFNTPGFRRLYYLLGLSALLPALRLQAGIMARQILGNRRSHFLHVFVGGPDAVVCSGVCFCTLAPYSSQNGFGGL